MKKLIIFALSLLLSLSLIACGDDSEDTSAVDTSTAQSEVCTVSFVNSGMNNLTLEKGSILQQPTDPEKNDGIFGGWYTDSAFTNAAAFPITVNENTMLYARFYDYKTAFAIARNNTVGESVAGYEYDYTLTATATYNSSSPTSGALSAKGNTVGNSKYSTSGEVSFYDAHDNSGLLFYDGSKYQIRRGNLLQNIALDQNGLLKSFKTEEVDDSYKFDSSSFAKALFEYDDNQLKSIAKTNVKDEYKLTTSFNASQGIALASKLLNNKIVKKLIGEVPSNSVQTGMYVSFDDGKVKSYRYEMSITVESVSFSLVYNLSFKNIGKAQSINPKTFEGISIDSTSISNAKNEINSFISAFANKQASGYDFTVKTGIDFPSKNEINSTFKGSAMRKTIDGTVYFHNSIEIDSDYKNADLYRDSNINDVKIKRTRLLNGEVWNIEKKVLDKTTQVSPYTANRTDSYYLFDLLSQFANYNFVQKVTKNGETTYSIGVSQNELYKALSYLNTQLDLNPLDSASLHPDIFGSFTQNSISSDDITLHVIIKNGALSKIVMNASGGYTTTLTGSRDFSSEQKADFNFSYELTVNSDGDNFTPFDTVKKAK